MADLIGIVRVSREGLRGDRLRSPEWQSRELFAWAKDHGHTIARIIEEIDVSGGTTNRKALREARRAIKDGEAHGIVAAYVSRFSRNTAEGLELVAAILDAGKMFVALDCPFDLKTPEGRKYLTDKLSEAQYERDRARRNFGKGVAGSIERGAHLSERFGYAKRRDGVLEVHPTEGPWIPRIYAWRIEGHSYQEIADLLNAAGVKTHEFSARRDGQPSRRRPARWRYNTVKNVLESRVYLGEAFEGDLVNPAAHEPLIDAATFAKVDAMRNVRPRRGKAEYELSGLLRCAGCGARIKGSTTTKELKSGPRAYRYYEPHGSECKCDGRRKVRAEVLEAAVLDVFADVTRGLRAYAVTRTDDYDAATTALELAVVNRKAVAEDMDLYTTSREAHRAAVAKAEAIVRECQSVVQAARARVTGVSATDDDLDNWSSLPLADRRRFLAEAFEVIYVSADRTGWAPVGRGELADPDRIAGDFLPIAE